MKIENIIIICLVVISILFGISIGFMIKQCKEVKPEVVYLKGDTVYVTKTLTKVIRDTTKVIIRDNALSSRLDTTFVSNLDTISLQIDVEAESDRLVWTIDFEHKDTELIRVDTLRTKEIVKELIVPEKKFYQEEYFNFGVGLVTAVILILVL